MTARGARTRPACARVLAALAVLVAFAAPASAAGTAWWDAPATPASALDAIEGLENASAVAVGAEGAIAAAAFPSGKGDGRASLRIARRGAAPDTLEIPGEVRSLMFADGGSELLVILAKRAKRRPPETALFAIDVETLRVRRRVGLPHSASGMAPWRERASLVVACDDEVRTFLLPDFDSGPLYLVPGAHRDVAAIGGSTFALATGASVLIVSLDDRPDENGLPLRVTVDAGAPVLEVAVVAGAPRLAVRRDGAEPARLDLPEAAFRPAAPESPGGRDAPTAAEPPVGESAAPAPPPPTAPPAPREDASPAPGAVPEAVPVPPASPAPPPESAGADAPAPDAPSETGATADAPIVAEIRDDVAPEPEESTPAIDGPVAIRGRITGDARGAVRAVVAYGPDNLLREAARVAPLEDGGYAFGDLPPGSYRLVLDGGGDRVVESDPAFQVVRVEDDGETVAQPFAIVRVR